VSAHPLLRIVITNPPPLAPDVLPTLTIGLRDEFELDIADLDAEECPPDLRFTLTGDREAWVYDHGEVADLIFVRIGGDRFSAEANE
jgi:hypothetical protein